MFLGDTANGVLAELAERTETLRVLGEETIITHGDTGSTMYFLISGRVRVHDGEVILATLVDGENFGEMSVPVEEVRSDPVTVQHLFIRPTL